MHGDRGLAQDAGDDRARALFLEAEFGMRMQIAA